MDKAATTACYGASAVTVIAGLTLHDWLALASLLIALMTGGINFYCKLKQLKALQQDK